MQPILPIYRKHTNDKYFLTDTRVPTRLLLAPSGEWVKTRPIGAYTVDLLGLSFIKGDRRIGPKNLRVRTVYVENPYGEIIAVETGKLPSSKLTQYHHGNYLDFRTEFDYLIPENRDRNAALAVQVNVNLEKGILSWVNTQVPPGYRGVGLDIDGSFVTSEEFERAWSSL